MHSVEIQKILPHRYPFLLIDRVVECTPNQKLVGYKNVTHNEEFFQGHFPGHPVMPGVLIVEALAQAAGLLAYKSDNRPLADRVVYLMALDGVKFRKPVVPGDKLVLEVTLLKQKGAIWKFKGVALVDGNKVSEAELLATIVDRGAKGGDDSDAGSASPSSPS
jgi:3-hydroxyacyl-[acyl-carrier-protein] dehydratase